LPGQGSSLAHPTYGTNANRKTKYGTNANKSNAFGKCVSGKVKHTP